MFACATNNSILKSLWTLVGCAVATGISYLTFFCRLSTCSVNTRSIVPEFCFLQEVSVEFWSMFFLTVAEHIDHQCFKSSYYPSFDHLPFVPWLFPVYLASKNCGELSWQGGCEAGGPILSTIQSCLHFVTYNSWHITRKASSEAALCSSSQQCTCCIK